MLDFLKMSHLCKPVLCHYYLKMFHVLIRFYQLDISRSIKECLSGKLIVEFPTFHVVLPSKVASYPTMDHEETSDNNAGSVNGEENEFSLASIPIKEKCAEACQDECI